MPPRHPVDCNLRRQALITARSALACAAGHVMQSVRAHGAGYPLRNDVRRRCWAFQNATPHLSRRLTAGALRNQCAEGVSVFFVIEGKVDDGLQIPEL